jgi:hypothetical protein
MLVRAADASPVEKDIKTLKMSAMPPAEEVTMVASSETVGVSAP